jgi:hypothetical protein
MFQTRITNYTPGMYASVKLPLKQERALANPVVRIDGRPRSAASAKFNYQLRLVQLDYETSDIVVKFYSIEWRRPEPGASKESPKH